MSDLQRHRWSFLDPLLPLGCALVTGFVAASQLDIAPAPLVFLGVSVFVYLVVSFAVSVFTVFRQRRLISELLDLDSETLMSSLGDDSSLCEPITGILLKRGEPKEKLADHALSLLLSPSADDRWHGWCTLEMHFPDIKERLMAHDSDVKQKLVGIEFRHNVPDKTRHLVDVLRSEGGDPAARVPSNTDKEKNAEAGAAKRRR